MPGQATGPLAQQMSVVHKDCINEVAELGPHETGRPCNTSLNQPITERLRFRFRRDCSKVFFFSSLQALTNPASSPSPYKSCLLSQPLQILNPDASSSPLSLRLPSQNSPPAAAASRFSSIQALQCASSMEAGDLFRFLRKAGAGRDAAVTVLLQDGTVLEFANRIECSELLATYPGYTICPAVALLRRQQGRMLTPDPFLEGGITYFLLEKPSPVGALQKSQQFAISKEHMGRILREGVKRTLVPVRKPLQNSAPGRAQSWVSSLSTIPEVDTL